MSVYIKIPESITIFERVADEHGEMVPRKVRKLSLFDVIDWATNDNYFGKSAKMGKVAAELLAEFEHAKPGDCVKLTSEQHAHVKAVLDAPSNPFLAIIAKQIYPHFDALLEPLSEEQYRKSVVKAVADG